MSKYLFKGMRRDNGEWVFGNYVEGPNTDIILTLTAKGCEYTEVSFMVIKGTVCQSTQVEYNFHTYFEHDMCEMDIPTEEGGKESIQGIVVFEMGIYFLNEIGGNYRRWIFSEVATRAIEIGSNITFKDNLYDHPELFKSIKEAPNAKNQD